MEPPGARALLHAGAVATPMDASGCGAISPESYPLPRKRLRLLAPRSARAVDAVGAVALGAVGACAADGLRMIADSAADSAFVSIPNMSRIQYFLI